jgi:multiple sugar transport system substrate-binding protein
MIPTFSRRKVLQSVALAAAGSITTSLPARHVAATTFSSVLCSTPPDPAPPGVADYAVRSFAAWQKSHDAYITYDPIAWPRLYQRLRSYFDADSRVYDLMYLANWVPEFHGSLLPLDDRLPSFIRTDLPESSWNACTWSGDIFGCQSTLSLLTLYFNRAHLEAIGISAPPTTWDELKSIAQELTRDGRTGWVSNYGTPGGVGGTASYWMAFLQQAGGTMYGDDGMPIFDDASGVDALQFMIDLMPYTHASSLSNTGIVDATNVFAAGEASLMMNWPFMWETLQTAPYSTVAGAVGAALLPAGTAGSVSIDSGEAWAVPIENWHEELGIELLTFYLEKPIQRMQALKTGWLPSRLSVLAEPDIQTAFPHAAALLAQAQLPFNSFLSPDYESITTALGTEIQAALTGGKTAAQAIADASDAVSEIVQARLAKESG